MNAQFYLNTVITYMRKKSLITSICLSLGLLMFVSCDKSNEPELPPKSKEDIWYWGYFKGTINGDSVSVENQQYDRKVNSVRSSFYFTGDWEVVPDSVNIMRTLICYNDNSELRITLHDLTPGERYLSLSVAMEWYDSWIKVEVYSGPTKERTVYIPNEENPFRVEIADVLWLSVAEPIIEVKLDGVLYNRDNPNDTMVVKGTYETR